VANRLGATFFRWAMGPVSYAGQCISAGRVKEGLAELARDGLIDAWRRGVAEVAQGAGAAVADVEALLPRDDVQAAADLLHESQQRAMEAWQRYAGHVGGLLAGVADLTVDGRVPEASLCLERLAAKVARDKPLAEPLRLLAVDTQRWQDLIFDCKRRLEDGPGLTAAFRRRRAMRLGAVSAAAALIAASVGAVGWAAVTRARVDRTLAAAVGPCDVESIPADTLARASSEQRARIEGLRSTCESEKAAAARARAEEARREAEAAAAAKVRAEREAACDELAAGVARGEAPADGRVAGDAAALLGRVARRALSVEDLGVGDAMLPCGDTAAGEALRKAFAEAVLAAPALWANAEVLSPAVGAVLAAHRDALPEVSRMRLGSHAEDMARAALIRGDPERLSRAGALCKLKPAVGLEVHPRSSCATVLR
jgi:hypothetical protein